MSCQTDGESTEILIYCQDYFYNNPETTDCELCSSNCIMCDDASTCTLCRNGYYVDGNYEC